MQFYMNTPKLMADERNWSGLVSRFRAVIEEKVEIFLLNGVKIESLKIVSRMVDGMMEKNK